MKPARQPLTAPKQTYFITTNAYDKRRIFQVTAHAELLIDTLLAYRREGKYRLHEFVAMPDHLHLLIAPVAELTIERIMQLIKGGFSFRMKRELGRPGEVWQRGFTDHRLRMGEHEQARDYIWNNPVKARLCSRPEEYPYSSANPRFHLDPVEDYLRG